METCGYCTYLDLNDRDSFDKYWCDKNLERHYSNDTKCSKFCKAYNRDEGAIKNAIDLSKKHTDNYGGCYLTTILCTILKLNDDNLYLKTFREFRENVLQKNEEYTSILVEYDIIGPKIANCISNDPLRRKIAEHYFNKYIVDIFYFIINKQTDQAINEYKEMTNNLKYLYHLDEHNITIEQINNADVTKSGHGIYMQKKITI